LLFNRGRRAGRRYPDRNVFPGRGVPKAGYLPYGTYAAASLAPFALWERVRVRESKVKNFFFTPLIPTFFQREKGQTAEVLPHSKED
jgi:hypothetical protein